MINYPWINILWNTTSPDCPSIHYNILASKCGSCPTTTNYTSVTCTDIPTDGSICTFAVQTVVCGNITGESSQVSLFNNNIPGQFSLNFHVLCWAKLSVRVMHEFMFSHAFLYSIIGSTECRPILISAMSLGVALFICIIGLITVIILFIKSKTKVGTVVVNTTVDKAQSRNTSVIQSSCINTKKNVSYVVHSPNLNQL